MKTQIAVGLLALCFSQIPYAQELALSNDNLATSYINDQCDFETVISKPQTFSKWFAEYDKYITQKALIACQAIYYDKDNIPKVSEYWSDDELKEILQTNLAELDRAFSLDENEPFTTLRKNYITWQSETSLPIDNDGVPRPASFDSRTINFDKEYFLTTTSGLPRDKSERFTLTKEQNDYCQTQFVEAKDCVDVFNAFNQINDKLGVFQKLNTIQQHNAYVALQNVKWDKFSDNSRFQSMIDIGFTSWVYREHFSRADDLIAPPPLQLFALRPSIVYEHLSDAPKGDRDEPALALEWVGFNAWDLSIPFGVSLTSVYADREIGKSVGHGLTFHLNNSFSFGFANRSGEGTSYYINLELMDWFGDNADMLNAYKKFK
ncbi:hypothetical protein R3X26_09410 [Vibrio sp. TH_r3]|uniref:hypothetical protein n=1 Tax=Vibrio sp. TH_r3 TaxID=3082084 RepID=UPI002953E0B8|nr:hypothetical protein [Vibrio sp. TH_r3]MDV7104611.1 hypothetical protein [Vibrio sp. TH_r3]